VFLIHSWPTWASTSTSHVLPCSEFPPCGFHQCLHRLYVVPCPLDLHIKLFTENLSPCLHHLHIQLCPLNLNAVFCMKALGPLVNECQHISINLLMVFSNSDQSCLPRPPSFLGWPLLWPSSLTDRPPWWLSTLLG
jgi:hypothetical protein